jgi:tetratricopeptide (TPR) repeat protein
LLYRVITSPEQSPVARATAVSRMAPALASSMGQGGAALLADQEPLVRRTAVDALAGSSPEVRTLRLVPMLADPVKGVRIAAARALAGLPSHTWSASDQAHWGRALAEYIAVQDFNADRPESYNNLGTLYMDLQDWPRAHAALEQAIQLDPTWALSSLNLADAYRAQGREKEAEALIRKVIGQHPRDAVARHALGLSLLRQQRGGHALGALQKAVDLEPENLRFVYVYAIALESQGQRRLAIQWLEKGLALRPADRDTLRALVALCTRMPNASCVQRHTQRLTQLEAGH